MNWFNIQNYYKRSAKPTSARQSLACGCLKTSFSDKIKVCLCTKCDLR